MSGIPSLNAHQWWWWWWCMGVLRGIEQKQKQKFDPWDGLHACFPVSCTSHVNATEDCVCVSLPIHNGDADKFLVGGITRMSGILQTCNWQSEENLLYCRTLHVFATGKPAVLVHMTSAKHKEYPRRVPAVENALSAFGFMSVKSETKQGFYQRKLQSKWQSNPRW